MTTTTNDTVIFTWDGGDHWQSAGQTASWHQIIRTEPGEYEARCTTINFQPCSLDDAYWVLVRIPGVVVGGWLPGWKDERELGRDQTFYIQAYGYAVRNSINDSSTRWSLR